MPLAPAAGHLVHRPGHLFQRVGRYNDAVKANQLAVVADEDYISQCRAQGLYPMAYYPHNIHFLWFAATMAGESKLAIDAADKTTKSIPVEALKDVPLLQTFLLAHDYSLVRFGKWDEILALPAPRADTMFTRATRSYARGMALIRKKDFAAATKEIDTVKKIAGDPKLVAAPTSMSLNLADSVLRVAIEVLDGELAAAQGNYDTAIAHLDRAVRYEDALIYTEPDDWHQPVRHNLGAVLLQAGRPVEAESVYWDDLRRHPKNGWSLFGLAQSLRAQNKIDQAKVIEADFKKAWADADVQLTASRF
jgi:tetratricopeptide (TPR) repeat protein